jgi:ribosome-associated translation inhibitor RaiA
MRVSLKTRHIPASQELEQLVERRARLALSRFTNRLSSVRLSLAHEGNGVDCLATAKMSHGRKLVVGGVYPSFESAIAEVCERMRLRLIRECSRGQWSRRSDIDRDANYAGHCENK